MNFLDAIKTTGPNALGPLKTGEGQPDCFYAVFDGSPILKNGKFGPESSFKTEEEATAFAKQFAEYKTKKATL